MKSTERDERGAAMVEYALLLALIAILAISAVSAFGGSLTETYEDIGSDMIESSAGP